MIKLLQSFIPLLLLIILSSFCRAAQPDDLLIKQQLQKLLHENSDTVYTATEKLVQLNDIRLYPLLANLYEGNLYTFKGGVSDMRFVIVGEPIKTETSTRYPLFSAFPEKKPLLDNNNKPLTSEKSQLTEVESGRRVRGLIEPLLAYIDLTSENIEKKKMAIKAVARNGQVKDITILNHLTTIEKDPIVLRSLKEAVLMIQMQSSVASERLKVLKDIESNYGDETLAFLEQRVKKDEKGQSVEKDPTVYKATLSTIKNIEERNDRLTIAQNLFTGLSLGSILILMALGLAIIYGLMGVINMAHGEFMMIGAYTTFIIQNFFISNVPEAYFDYFFIISMPLSFIVAGIFGYIIEISIIRYLYKKPLESLLATWGVSLVLIQGARSLFGDLTSVKTPAIFSGGLEVVPQLVLPYNRLFILILTVFIVITVMLILFKTSFGLKIRAVTQNRNMSACLGIPTRRVDSFAFFLGTGIAGIAGWAITLIGNVVPNMGQSYIVDSFLVVVTGGVGKLLGTIWSGLGIGFLSKFLESLFEAVYGKVIILGLIILFLQLKPTGLFPAKGRNEE